MNRYKLSTLRRFWNKLKKWFVELISTIKKINGLIGLIKNLIGAKNWFLENFDEIQEILRAFMDFFTRVIYNPTASIKFP